MRGGGQSGAQRLDSSDPIREVALKRSFGVLAALAVLALVLPAAAAADRTVFVVNSDSESTGLAAFSADGGPLVPLPGTPVAAGEDNNGVVVSPDARNAYVSSTGDDAILSYSLSATGCLLYTSPSPRD